MLSSIFDDHNDEGCQDMHIIRMMAFLVWMKKIEGSSVFRRRVRLFIMVTSSRVCRNIHL